MSRRLGIAALVVIATIFGANHVAARVAFDHGASVAAAVAIRSAFTALFLVLLLKATGTKIVFNPRLLGIGALVAIQSYCLYASVARIPVALALLVFNLHPLLFMLLSWATGKEKLHPRALVAIAITLAGLTLVLDIQFANWAARWQELGPGVAYGFAAGVSFAIVVYLNTYWAKAIDGRVRTMWMMAVTAALVLAGGAAADAFSLPRDTTGWVGVVLLTLLYGTAITSLFITLPRLSGGASSTVALNFEPIAVLAIAWVTIGQAVSASQVVGALVVVGAIAWLGMAKR